MSHPDAKSIITMYTCISMYMVQDNIHYCYMLEVITVPDFLYMRLSNVVTRNTMNNQKLKSPPTPSPVPLAALPPSSSESVIRVSCMVSGDTTLYFSSVVVVVVVTSVMCFNISTTEM